MVATLGVSNTSGRTKTILDPLDDVPQGLKALGFNYFWQHG